MIIIIRQTVIAVAQKGEQMDDLISRQDALDILTEWKRAFKEMSHNQSAADIELIKSEFAKLIPVKNPERKPGKWEIYVISAFDGEGCRCSECGLEGAPYWDFCPGCGVRMEDIDDKRKSD